MRRIFRLLQDVSDVNGEWEKHFTKGWREDYVAALRKI